MSVVDKIQLRRGGPFYDIRDNSKSPLDHTHDDRYYTESEVNSFLAEKAPLVHNHDDRYYTESEVDSMGLDIYNAINSKLPLSGGTVTGNLTVNSNIYGDVGHGIQTGGFIRQNIDSNSNLDEYTSPGFYKCTQNATAVTLTNCPTGLAFTLDVIHSVGNSPDYTGYRYITQIIKSYFNDVFLRRGQGEYEGTITWQPWALMAYQGNAFVAHPSYEPSIDQVYDASSFITTSNSAGTFPSGATKYGAGLTLPYRKPFGNSKPDYAGQIYIPNGGTGTPNSMFFRTSNESAWETWNRVARADEILDGNFRVITSFPTGKEKSFIFSLDANVTIGSITIPRYAKGIYIGSTASADATLMAVDYSGYFYVAFRNGTTWQNAKKH